MSEPAFCIYITTVCEGAVPLVRDGDGKPCVFKTEVQAQREIANFVMTRLQEFIDGEDRDFEDAMTVEPPKDIPNAADLIGRTRMLFELSHLAQQTDSTQLITIMLAGSTYAPPIQGVTLGQG